MTKQKFIQELSECLLNEVDSQEYHNSIAYYSNYIDEEMRKGRREEEVVEQLGSPRLIAKTIIDSQIGKELQEDRPSYQQGNSYSKYDTLKREWFHILLNGQELKWHEKLLAAIVLILVVCVVLAILGVAVAFLIKVVFPIIVILFIVRFLYQLFRK